MIKTITNGSAKTPVHANNKFLPEQVILQTYLLNKLVPTHSQNFASSVAYWRNPSEKQFNVIKKIISEVEAAQNAKVVPTANVASAAAFSLDLTEIVKMMTAAGQNLKRPKVNLVTANQVKVRITRPSNGKHAGKIFLNEAGFGSRFWGMIGADGVLGLSSAGRQFEQEIKDLLTDFSKDPVTVARNYGRMMGHCCFCSLPLTTEESLHAGYGDTCAKHYRLPWGKQPNKFIDTVEKRMTVAA